MFIIDTNILLWYLNGDDFLSPPVKELLAAEKNLYVSIATYWEIAIKNSIGKLDLSDPIDVLMSICSEQGFQTLSIEARHLAAIPHLPEIHRDPFDRLIVAQAITEGMRIVTSDQTVAQYPVDCILN